MLQFLAARPGASWLSDEIIFRVEFRRDFLALGTVILIMLAIWAFQEWGLRGAAHALGRVGIAAFVGIAIGAVALIVLGLL